MKELILSQAIADRSEKSLESYFTDIRKIELIGAGEEGRLARLIREGDETALGKLVRTNLRFVISVAKQYQRQGVSICDLINEGNLGLITAARRFDATKGYKFISYAVWWIRQAIITAIAEQSRMIHMPYSYVTLKSKMAKCTQKLEQVYGRLPTIEEIAFHLDVDEEKVRDLYMLDRCQLSFYQQAGRESVTDVIDTIPCRAYEADEFVLQDSLRQDLLISFGVLNARDREVILHYYGLNGVPAMSLDHLAEKLKLSVEHTRRIKDLALQKIRDSSYAPLLQLYLC